MPNAYIARNYFPARRPLSAKTEISSLLVTNAAVAEKFCSSPRQASGHEHSNVCAQWFRSAELLFGTRREHPHCSRQTLPFRGSLVYTKFHWYMFSGFHDTSLQSKMRCVIYIRKVLCIMSCCQVARPCCRRYTDNGLQVDDYLLSQRFDPFFEIS